MRRRSTTAGALALAIIACHPQDKTDTTTRPQDGAPAATVRVDTGAVYSTTRTGWLVQDDDSIGARFQTRFGSAPGLAWLIPPHTLIAERRYATPRTFSRRGVEVWTYQATLDSARVTQLRHQQHVACETNTPLYAYAGQGSAVEYAERVLVTDSAIGGVHAGLVVEPAGPGDQVLATLLTDHGDATHRDTAFGAAPDDEFYSFHAVYDTSAAGDEEMGTHGGRYLVRRGLLLHARGGAVIASSVTDVAARECDGCGTPSIKDDFRTVFDVLQVLRLPGFPHPVLLLDTSTIEGRALSLATFDDEGTYRSYRVYEYVVNCF